MLLLWPPLHKLASQNPHPKATAGLAGHQAINVARACHDGKRADREKKEKGKREERRNGGSRRAGWRQSERTEKTMKNKCSNEDKEEGSGLGEGEGEGAAKLRNWIGLGKAKTGKRPTTV